MAPSPMLIYFKNYPSSDSYRVGNDETVYKATSTSLALTNSK